MGGPSAWTEAGGDVAVPAMPPWSDGRAPTGGGALPLLKVTAAIADAVSAPEVFEALVDHVAEALGASSVGLWLLDGTEVSMVRSRGYSDDAVRALRTLDLEAERSMPVLDCLRSGAPVWVPSQPKLYERYPHLRSLSPEPRSYRVASLPLVANGRILGTLGLTIEAAGDATSAEKDFLLLVARYASQALERLRLFEAEARSRAQADAAVERLRVLNSTSEQLYRFAQAVVAAERVEVVYDAALTSIEAALGVHRAAVLVVDEDGVMRFKAWRDLSDVYRAAVEGHSPWPHDAISPQPVVVEDALNDPAWAPYAETFRRERIGAVAFIPLVSRGRLLGKFMLYYDGPRALSAGELEVARAIANHLGSVIARFAALTKLEETIRYNELFAGVLAHDLRTPLGAMMNAAQLLLHRQEAAPASRGDAINPLGRIVRSGERMRAMIAQLLDFTESRSGGGMRVELRPTNLDDLCAQAVGEVELVHPQWSMKYAVHGDPVGRIDPERLLQAISNLLSNAGQHGQGGPISISVDGTRPDELVLAVHNSGAVPPELLPHIFDPFRTTRQRRGQSSGLGLGLFIVREIVRAHRGAVDVTSSEDTGTTVALRLPR